MTTCKEKANRLVTGITVGGGVGAAIPLPGTSVALIAAEGVMIMDIAKIYGEKLSYKECLALGATLGAAGIGLKAAAIEACNLIPFWGWAAKSAIAAGAIKAIGSLAIAHFEKKYPGKDMSKRRKQPK